MTAIADVIAKEFTPNAPDAYAHIHQFITGGMATPEEAISLLIDFAYRAGARDMDSTIKNRSVK